MKTLQSEAQKIVEGLEGQGFDRTQIADALCDGEWLTNEGYTDDDQELIDTAYAIAVDKGKSKKEMRSELKGWLAGVINREHQKSLITKIGRDYVYFVSLYEGSKPQKTTIESFYATKDLYADQH